MTESTKTLLSVTFDRKRLHEEIVTVIQQRILAGELPPGERLPAERELADLMHVNRATVREALRKLESLELVEIRHGDGVYVKDYLESGNLELIRSLIYLRDVPNIDVFDNILELRRLMVPEMAAGAAVKRTGSQVAALEALIADTSLSMREKDIALHHLIARASHNILYVITLNFFYRLSGEVLDLYFNNRDTVEKTARFHNDICSAIKDKKPVKAKKIMIDILVYAEARIREALSRF